MRASDPVQPCVVRRGAVAVQPDCDLRQYSAADGTFELMGAAAPRLPVDHGPFRPVHEDGDGDAHVARTGDADHERIVAGQIDAGLPLEREGGQ